MLRWFLTVTLAVTTLPAIASSSRDTAEAVTREAVRLLYVQSDRHWHKGEYCRIVNLNRMVVAAYPHFIEPYVDSCWLLWSMGRDGEAEALYDQGIAANPDSYAIYYEKGFYLMTRRKDLKGALRLFEIAVTKKDCDKMVYHTLAHAYEKDGQLQRALDTWNKVADDPSHAGRAAARLNRERVRRLIESGGK